MRFCTVKCSTVHCTQKSRTNYRYHPIVNCMSVCYAFFTLLLSFFALSVNALIIHRTHSYVRVKLKTYAWMADSLAGWLAGWLSERDKQSSTNQNDIIDVYAWRVCYVFTAHVTKVVNFIVNSLCPTEIAQTGKHWIYIYNRLNLYHVYTASIVSLSQMTHSTELTRWRFLNKTQLLQAKQ